MANEESHEEKIYLTLALGPDVVKNKEVFDQLISKCINYNVDGFYFVLKSPNNQFLITDEEYLYALMDGFISLIISEKDILLGYANQQSLIYSAVGVETIASGNFRNVRSFDPDIFVENEEEDFKRRGIWYYDGNSLSEYKQQQLSLAYRRGLNTYFGPQCEYCKNLLDSSNPATILWREPFPFKHYLHELRNQWLELNSVNPAGRIDFIIETLIKVKEHIKKLESKGFSLGTRAFSEEVSDACIGSLRAIKHDRKYDLLQL
ncbi:hypothetical protein [Wukongibacter sp. M2B1]|uniref:hypothetical protein n=1 Tax=Wukongibacter sp. M2B1 TaxID=3088895 RepID=UPI003D7BFF62